VSTIVVFIINGENPFHLHEEVGKGEHVAKGAPPVESVLADQAS